MPVFGLALTLAPGCEERVRQRLARDGRIQVGEACGMRLPVVLDSPGARDGEVFVSSLLESGQVLHVDVAFASFEDLVTVSDEEGSGGSPA